MRLPGFKRFQLQDYAKKYNDLTETLFNTLNPFMEVITQALNKRLNFNDNFDCHDVTLDIVAPATNLTIANPQKGIMRGSQVLYCINKLDSSDPLLSAPFIQFTTSGEGQIVITNITGLTTGKTYTIRMIFYR